MSIRDDEIFIRRARSLARSSSFHLFSLHSVGGNDFSAARQRYQDYVETAGSRQTGISALPTEILAPGGELLTKADTLPKTREVAKEAREEFREPELFFLRRKAVLGNQVSSRVGGSQKSL